MKCRHPSTDKNNMADLILRFRPFQFTSFIKVRQLANECFVSPTVTDCSTGVRIASSIIFFTQSLGMIGGFWSSADGNKSRHSGC